MRNTTMTSLSPEAVLREYWGYPSFRPLQREIIEKVLSRNDCLALLPTGGGKSICYQVPAVMLNGVCLVISPLIALMRDQVYQLRERGIEAEAIHSGLNKMEIDRILDNCIYGNVKLLYLSPERLNSTLAETRIRKMRVSLVAVDEAHCISQWGHDFRPAYRNISTVREWHPSTPILALTATATERVREDVMETLQMQDPEVVLGSFRRQNLSYLVYPREDKWKRTLEILSKLPGSKLVYTRSRRKATQLAAQIAKQDLRCEAYHAGMPSRKRELVQERWLEGETPVVVCTTAFGMGIDKPDVRTVIHFDLPGSLEEYYQEAGRAGRDGKRAFCVMLYDQADITQLRERAERAFPDAAELTRVYRALCGFYQIPVGSGMGESFVLHFREFLDRYKLDPVHTYHCLKGLERNGWLQLNEAVLNPSTVHVLLTREMLHDYQDENPEKGELVKVLLRNYEGLFLEPVRIREKDVARLMEMKEKELSEMLAQLNAEKVISYIPASDLPRIAFLRERVEDRNLTFDTRLITHLRTESERRTESVVRYIHRQECREQYLLSYFGEAAHTRCGNCDICRSQEQNVSYDSILLHIPEAGIRLRDLVNIYDPSEQNAVKEMLRTLESDELIVLEQDLVRLRNKVHE